MTIAAIIDTRGITRRYWGVLVCVMLSALLEFFDFFLIGFVVAVVAKPWHLTFGQSSVVLLAAGVGAIFGSLYWGRLGDQIGRKPSFILGILTFSIGTGLMALTPHGSWPVLALFRLIVGAGVGAVASLNIPLLVEFTPTRHRTYLGALGLALVPIGTLVASSLAATVEPAVGWRGLFLIGLAPALLAVAVAIWVPESPRWLLSQGKLAEARNALAWITERPVTEDLTVPPEPASLGYRDLLAYPKSFWLTVLAWFGATTAVYGITLWGPTLLVLLLQVKPAQAAAMFVLVSLGGFAGRLLFSFLPVKTGRRRAAMAGAACSCLCLALAGFLHGALIGGVSVFWLLLIVGDVFTDGSFANLGPFTSEIFPASLRTHGMGLAETANGVGKILGPLGLALIAGSSNFVSPQATRSAVVPGMVYLALFSLLVFAVFLFIPIEPVGKSLEQLEAELVALPAAASPSTSLQ